ncbi:MAG TPA: long-chain fatty acid--CoA ligase [Vicinamibacteria bacterium]|nr:long-chain fatty acid--CoA ligase [Vicinamibacteria bacterium]
MEFETLNQLLAWAAETYQKPDALMFKKGGSWHRVSSAEWLLRSRRLALGFHGIGIRRGDRVALLSENRHEWFLVDAALQILGAANVPLYATLPGAQVSYIVRDSGARLVVVSDRGQQEKIAGVRSSLTKVERIISLDAPLGDAVAISSLEEKGRELEQSDPELAAKLGTEVTADDLASIIYTSGTTGEPKGVMLTQANFVSNVKASLEVLPVGRDDVALSALPYCHVFERMVAHYLFPAAGASVAIAQSLEHVVENIGEIRPTVMTMVPRFYEKLYARVTESVEQSSAVKKRIFHWAVATGTAHGEFRLRRESAPPGLALKYKMATALVFGKLHRRLGGRLRFFVSGSAPLPTEIAKFFWAAGITILEGYGLTETSPVISVNHPDRIRFGTVGQVIPGVEVEIAEDGEIFVRGPNVMKGYWGQEEASRETVDARGFLHTGDIGELSSDGFLRITDRKKDIIITSGGKNIAPQPIEGLLKTNAFIAEVVVVGNRRRFPSALVVPDFERLTAWCRENALPSSDRHEMASHPKVRELFNEQVASQCNQLPQHEKIKKVYVLAQEFSIEGGELTPTMKVKRSVVESRYKHLIDELYGESERAIT